MVREKEPTKNYVEMLEEQQGQLVYALQELYRRVSQGRGWQGKYLTCEENGHPLTHDLLSHLGALEQPRDETFEHEIEMPQNGGYMSSPSMAETALSKVPSPVLSDAIPTTYFFAMPDAGFSSQEDPGLKVQPQDTEDKFDCFAPWTTDQYGENLTIRQNLQQWPDTLGPFSTMDSMMGIDWIDMPFDDPFCVANTQFSME
ncbi:hypothetical protein BBP40_011980 [Aspergillus hancockii]|nr:hypothetical protein BBP40_011980 [Aspergillus hancockii]